MILRDYQQHAIDGVRAAIREGHQRVLLVAPTGAGKTVMFAYIASEALARGNQAVICAHREELIDQVSRTLTQFEVPHGFVAAGRKQESSLITVASVQTLVNRLDSLQPALIILDEAHHAVAGSWRRIINAYPSAVLVGVTATPERLDGSGLGDIFQTMVEGPQVAELQERGFLSNTRYFGPCTVDPSQIAKRAGEYTTSGALSALMPEGNIGKVTGEAIEEYKKHGRNMPAVVFCVSIGHAQHVAEEFCKAGFRWASLDSKMSKESRRQVVADLRSGALQGVSSCDIISEGFDLPAASVAILLRPTKSLGLYMQQVGRVLRTASGKEFAVIIDHVSNVGKMEDGQWKETHGPIEKHRFWSLDGKQRVKETIVPCKRCPECYALNPVSVKFCIECGFEFPVEAKEQPKDTGIIAEIDKQAMVSKTTLGTDDWILSAKFNEVMRWARTEEQVKHVAKLRGYKDGWVHVIMEGREKYRRGMEASAARKR